MKRKTEFPVRAEEELLSKFLYLADTENLSVNNLILKMMRQSVAYHERTKGKIDMKAAQLLLEKFKEASPEDVK